MDMGERESIAVRSVKGSLFTVTASAITVVSGFVRSVLLARLLAPEHFGVMALSLFFLSLTSQVQRVGLNKAFTHRKGNSSEDVSTYAILRVGLTVLAVGVALIVAPFLNRFYPDQPLLAPVLISLAVLELVQSVNGVGRGLLGKELHFKRLAVIDVTSSLTMTIVAPLIALAGGGIWALVAERVINGFVNLFGLWVFRPPWRPVLKFDRKLTRWYFDFGKYVFANANIRLFLDQFDDFWSNTFLGMAAGGYYAKAYEFARYPRRVLSGPLITVFFPTFAKLQDDRLHLSKAFYRVCSLIIRVGFPVFGTFGLVAPEFVRIFLGDVWVPTIIPLQLMLVYTLLDPLFSISGNLLSALGHPKLNTKVQIWQLVIFLPAVVLLGTLYNIKGVAIAADLMMIVGITLIFLQVKNFVDFSLRRMFFVPALGLVLGLIIALVCVTLLNVSGDWTSILVKGVIVPIIYFSVSLTLERQEYIKNAQLLWRYTRKDFPRNKLSQEQPENP